MAGLNLGGANYSGVFGTPQPSYGSQASYASGAGTAAFAVVPTGGPVNPMHPTHPVGMATWLGVAAIAGLLFVRYSLPN